MHTVPLQQPTGQTAQALVSCGLQVIAPVALLPHEAFLQLPKNRQASLKSPGSSQTLRQTPQFFGSLL